MTERGNHPTRITQLRIHPITPNLRNAQRSVKTTGVRSPQRPAAPVPRGHKPNTGR